MGQAADRAGPAPYLGRSEGGSGPGTSRELPLKRNYKARTGEEKSKSRFQRTPCRSPSLQSRRRRRRRLGLNGQESGSAPTSVTATAPSGSTCHETLHAKEVPRLNPA